MTQAENINIDDAVLIEQSRRGDSTAMERLIIRYQNRIYNVILKICGNTDDAAELTQDTFVKIIENLDRLGIQNRCQSDLQLLPEECPARIQAARRRR
ncbi:MAG: RNA polymerase sigma factor [Planctomycetota bacterium]